MAIKATYSLESLPHREAPMWWHKRGLSQTASGYGIRLATPHLVQLPGSPRWRRVYCCIHSNAGTCYVETGPKYRDENGKTRRDWIVIH